MPDASDFLLRVRYFLSHPAYRRHRLRAWGRLICWRIHCLLGRPAEIRLPRWQARFYLPPRWGGEGTTMIYVFREEYEPELQHLDRLVHPGAVVIDAGANCGIYTVAAGKLAGAAGRVVAIEPTARATEALRRNIALNSLAMVRVYDSALSDRDGTARLYRNRGPVAASLADADADAGAYDEVATVCLDSIVARERLTRLDLIKLDIEGAEELALRGGAQSIARWHPDVIFEVNPGAAAFGGSSADAAWRLLGEWGYAFFRITAQGTLESVAALPETGAWEFCNFVARHGSRPA
jgi:FkbM family methyltransferase